MNAIIRKNEILPPHLDPERFAAIFWHIREHPGTPQSKRVEWVLELLSSLRDVRRLRDRVSKLEQMQILTRLRNALRAYRWVTQISPTSKGFHASLRTADIGLSGEDAWEYEAIGILLDIVPYLGGKRPRIRRCADAACNEWFFAAKREDQQFCSGNCRQHHYDNHPTMRARKKRYMRGYRELTARRLFR